MNYYPSPNTPNPNCVNDYTTRGNNSEEENVDGNTSSPFVHKYFAEKTLFGLSFLNNNSSKLRCAISSMELSLNNFIQLIEYDDDNNHALVNIARIQIEYPCTKLSWSNDNYNSNLLGTASDKLRIYYYNEHNQLLSEKKCFNSAKPNINNKEGPLSALEWNRINHKILGVTSIDTTASIWDIEAEQKLSHLIANDKECYDISFGSQENCFITCGGDGTIRQFDLRQKEHCWLVYQGLNAIMKCKWNPFNDNFIAFTGLDEKDVNIIDRRNANTLFSSLKYHTSNVNNCMWSPTSNCILLSVSDDNRAIMWDIQNSKGAEAIMEYKAEGEIENCDLVDGKNGFWVGIACGKSFQMVLVNK